MWFTDGSVNKHGSLLLFIICPLCGLKIRYNDGVFTKHVAKVHGLTGKLFYDTYIRKSNGLCSYCGKPVHFVSIRSGYNKFCSHQGCAMRFHRKGKTYLEIHKDKAEHMRKLRQRTKTDAERKKSSLITIELNRTNSTYRENQRKGHIREWKNNESRKDKQAIIGIASLKKLNRFRKNFAEEHLHDLLRVWFPNKFAYYGDNSGSIKFGRKVPDFVSEDGSKLIIELFGEAFHDESDITKRQEYFASFGYKVFVVWYRDIVTSRVSTIRQQLTEFILENDNRK